MANSNQINPAGLYIVATPIGNLADISLRALDILKSCDLMACEDTRVTGVLLAHYGIKKPLVSYNDHNAPERRPEIFAALENGKRVALVSDAGTPLISDPGYKLVREAVSKNIYVTAIPGASSVLSALCLSGLPSDSFFFGGFLPVRSEALQNHLTSLANTPATLIFFESARRLEETLEVMLSVFSDRPAAVVREITKIYEEVIRGKISEIIQRIRTHGALKGEIVLVIGAAEKQNVGNEDIEKNALLLLQSHSVKETAAILAEQSGKPRKEIYSLVLKLASKHE